MLPALQVLMAYYQQQRQAEERSQARTTIRMLESLVRVSQVRNWLLAIPSVALRTASLLMHANVSVCKGPGWRVWLGKLCRTGKPMSLDVSEACCDIGSTTMSLYVSCRRMLGCVRAAV